mgnify:CR=1 FL=1
MKLGLSLQTSLQQTLTPQQVQYLKMLMLNSQQLEQHVRNEMETNPMLEEAPDVDPDMEITDHDPITESAPVERDEVLMPPPPTDVRGATEQGPADDFDPKDAFEFYQLIWGEDPSAGKSADSAMPDEDDGEGYQYRDTPSFTEEFLDQIRFIDMPPDERFLAEYIIGNIDDDGYLRRDMSELLDEVNAQIAEHNLALLAPALLGSRSGAMDSSLIPDVDEALEPISTAKAEHVLRRLRHLDPPGVGSRDLRECLLAQLDTRPKLNAAQKLAREILSKAYDAFANKKYEVIEKRLHVSEDYLREALDVIRGLNPRPGGGTFGPEVNTLVPDFIVERDTESDDFFVTVNDSRLPALRVSTAYERLRKDARYQKFNKETKEWLRHKYEDAKFLIQAIRQRKTTMLKVMTAIVGLQRDFFVIGNEGMRPLIYRDVADLIGMDLSTVCRIVNGKYVLTEFGTFELKYFFSEALLNDDGEEVSTRIIKQRLKELIDAESKDAPLSDDKLTSEMLKLGFHVARRTIAKYREQLHIPVARLRREL